MIYRTLAISVFAAGFLSLAVGMGCTETSYECPENYEFTENNLCKPVKDLPTPEDITSESAPSESAPSEPESSPEGLPVTPFVDEEGLNQHITSLMAIAAEHNNNRAVGTSGYEASVTYVSNYLQEAGFEIIFQEFPYETNENFARKIPKKN